MKVEQFNKEHKWLARGIAMVPVASTMTQQYGPALVHVRMDGSVSLASAGAEIGQSLATKCIQAAAYALSSAVPAGPKRQRLAAYLLTTTR